MHEDEWVLFLRMNSVWACMGKGIGMDMGMGYGHG